MVDNNKQIKTLMDNSNTNSNHHKTIQFHKKGRRLTLTMKTCHFDGDKMSITCIDCNKRKAPASAIGSWQCTNCQERLFNRVRSKTGRHKNKYFTQIEKLMNRSEEHTSELQSRFDLV